MSTWPDVTWAAPAKLNLFLHVMGRRDDGFHDLQTVFQFLDLHDTLCFRPRQDGRIVRHGGLATVPVDEDLVVRAARTLRLQAGRRGDSGVDIVLAKRIPDQAGLGGGSSDAATTLVALNYLWSLNLGLDELAVLGAQLGADVPVFIHGYAAWAEGRGDQLAPVTLPEPWYLVVKPDCAISTATLFASPDLRRDSEALCLAELLAGQGRNDFQPLAEAACPDVAEALAWLGQFGPARLTGTGACVFVPFGSRKEALEAHADLPEPWQGFVTRGLNRSPLLDSLDAARH